MSLSLYQQIIHNRTYARKHGNRLEYFGETVDRYVDYLKNKFPEGELNEKLEDCRVMIKEQKIMPSMRLFFAAGEAVESENAMAFNCKFQAIDSLKSFADLLYSLLCTCGVGISVQARHITKINKLPQTIEKSEETILVDDSRMGWGLALESYLSNLFECGISYKFDISKVRLKGAPLLISGGYASGPEPLLEVRDWIEKIAIKRSGEQLRSIDCFDIACIIAQCAVQGGVRRAAIITLFDEDDESMFLAKSKENLLENPHRYNSNNTMVYSGKDVKKLEMAIEGSKVNGEPGILFEENLIRKMNGLGRYSDNGFGVNPCVTGDTLILTKSGYQSIRSLVDTNIDIWNGHEWSNVEPFSTGMNKIMNIKFSNGMDISCTQYHNWHTVDGIKMAKDLTTEDKLIKIDMPIIEFEKTLNIDYYSQGFYSADGNKNYDYSWIYEPKFSCIERLNGNVKISEKVSGRAYWKHGVMLPKDFVPIGHNINKKIEWFAGLIDGDGNITKNPNSVSIHLSSIDESFLKNVLLMLNELGCQPKIITLKDAEFKDMPDGNGGSKSYYCQKSFRLILCAMDVKKLIDTGLVCNRLKLPKQEPNRNASRFLTPIEITFGCQEEETFCLNEPKNHTFIANGVITGNCGEIILKSNQFCNLVEVVLRPDHDFEMDLKKVEHATFLALLQATLTDYHFISKEAKQNQENDPIIGVSLTGLCDCSDYSFNNEHYAELLSRLKTRVDETVSKYWKMVGLKQEPKGKTCIKPSGTVSQIVNSSSGVHARFAKYYIRRVLIGSDSKLYHILAKNGIPYLEFDCIDGRVFEFPVKAPQNSIVVSDMDAIKQLEYVSVINKVWCDFNASVTVYVKKNEWDSVISFLKENKETISLSFLPYEASTDTTGFLYLVYEEIDEQKYNQLESNIAHIQWEKMMCRTKENMNNFQEFACTGGSCSI
jgi:ribonucleotide reductase alpha subunit